MKHTYTKAQLQSAIDVAIAAEKGDAYLARRPDIATRSWPNEAYLRGAIARAFLAALPEPEPPTVDGKTPGLMMWMILNPNSPWVMASDETKAEFEAAASAVLAAFGNQPQPAETPWTEWHGGPCPLEDEEVEDLEWKLRDGTTLKTYASILISLEWGHSDGPFDIIAYRVLKWRAGFGPEVKEANARAEKAEAELARIIEAAHEAGWNGVDNPKDLAQFIKRQAEELTQSRSINAELIKDKLTQSQFSQLRPITEAGPVPEGCARFSGYKVEDGDWLLGNYHSSQDTHFADIQLPAVKADDSKTLGTSVNEIIKAIKPEPETFEAHGKTWTRHTPGDAMPCDGEKLVACLFADDEEWKTRIPAQQVRWSKSGHAGDIIGWRYADEPTPEPLQPEPWVPKVGNVVTLKSGGPKMTVNAEESSGLWDVVWISTDGSLQSASFPTACLQPA